VNANSNVREAVALGLNFHHGRIGDAALLEDLHRAAETMRGVGLDLQAGWTMHQAVHVAWGDIEAIRACQEAAVNDFQRVLDRADPTSLVSLATLKALAIEIGSDYGVRFPDTATRMGAYRAVEEELAQRLLAAGRDSPRRASYLALGLVISWSIEHGWIAMYPEHEVDDATHHIPPGGLSLTIPSAFHLFIRQSDWAAADEVARLQPTAFSSPGLRGWRTAVRGLLDSGAAPEAFDEAAAIFSTDTEPHDLEEVGGHWSSRNVDLWAKYFRARASLAQLARNPSAAPELLSEAAAALQGTESGWTNPQVSCLRIVTNALVQILASDPQMAASAARLELAREMQWAGDRGDLSAADQFLAAATTAFEELRRDPTVAVMSGSFPNALELLGKISIVGGEIPPALEPLVAEKARAEWEGPIRTWVHRTLESITDEDVLRRLLLRLHQATLPVYAQIRHGPLEYGKDLVVLTQEGSEVVLRMYQAKIGDLTRPTWRAAKPELEEIFQVDMSALQFPIEPTVREGVLVFNGHVNPHTEPVVEGWLDDQRRGHARRFGLMNLDALVNWIFSQNLLNEFRAALHELGVPVVEAPVQP
jgi:hypothetical protein